MMSCIEFRELLPAYVALELGAADERAVREHIDGCSACQQEAIELDPLLTLALPLARTKVQEDDFFVAGVMAGVRQRRLEKKLVNRRAPWMAAAAALVVMIGGYTVLRERMNPTPVMAVQTPVVKPIQTTEKAFVEVREGGVRVYQRAGDAKDRMQIAFVVDPQAEL